MRKWFLLVVLANVLLFMWQFNTAALVQDVEHVETSAYSGQEPIVLVNERNRGIPGGSWLETAAAVTDTHEAKSGLANKLRSDTTDHAAGKHEAKLNVIAKAGEKFPGSCYDDKPFSREDRAARDYLVFYPAAETMEQSGANLEGNANAMASLELLKKNYPKIMVTPISDAIDSCQWPAMQNSLPVKPVAAVESSITGSASNAGK